VVFVFRGPSPSCGITATKSVAGRAGANRIHLSGRPGGRPLSPGSYGITVVAVRGGSASILGRLPVEVLSARGRTHSGRALAPACFGQPAGGLAPGVTLGGSSAGAAAHALRPPAKATPDEAAVAKLGAPQVSLSNSSGGLGWVAILLLAVLGTAGAFFLLYVVRFFRGSWNP
jgi:hypothetical protein